MNLRWERICLEGRRPGFDPWVGKILQRRAWQPTPVSLHGQRSLAGCSPGVQYPCMDRGAWRAAVLGSRIPAWTEEPGGLQSRGPVSLHGQRSLAGCSPGAAESDTTEAQSTHTCLVVLFLVFRGTSILFSIVTAPIYTLTNSAQGFPFLRIIANTCYLLSF